METKTDTIVRTVVLVIALINQIATNLGYSAIPLTNEELAAGITSVVTIAAAIWAWWKNNSFTKNAIEADKYLAELNSDN